MPRTSAKRRRRVLVRLLVAAALAAAIAAPLVLRSDDDLRSGSELVSEDAHPQTINETPSVYHAVYRFEDHTGDETVVNTDRLWVQRPFDSRLETWSGSPPGEELSSIQVTTFGTLAGGGGSGQDALLAVPPGLAASDLRPAPVLDEALETGSIDRRERRRVAGRECTVYRAGGPVNAGDLTPYNPEATEHADFCVDDDGLVLEHVWFDEGRMLQRRVATELDLDPEIDDALFTIPDATELTTEQTGGGLRRITDDSRTPERFWELRRQRPQGFEHLGRFAVAAPQPGGRRDPESRERALRSVDDVWVRGSDMLIVSRGSTIGGVRAFPSHPYGRSVELGPLGRGQLILDLRLTEVLVNLEGGDFVRVAGTLEPQALIDLARDLQEVPGGEITCADEQGEPEPCS